MPEAGSGAGVLAGSITGFSTGGAAAGTTAGVAAGMSEGFTNGPLLPQPASVADTITKAINRAMFLMGGILDKFMGEV